MYVCPLRSFYDNSYWYEYLILAYQWREKGVTVYGQGWGELPGPLVDAIKVIDATKSEIQKDEMDRAERARKNKTASKGRR